MKANLIAITDICLYEKIELNFIEELADFGLITTTVVQKTTFIEADEIPKLTRYKHLHQDLEINLEGLHAVDHLLNQLEDMQDQLVRLHNELNYYKQIEKPVD